ncbi:MAG TPA: F0F1 ATP synthase subunit A [Clostridia bacterium]|nr:F0F1 ATP synthase subunit A [Clostridia bacterium]
MGGMEEGLGARLIDVGNYQISETILVTWIVMAVIIALAIAARIAFRNFKTIPKGVQNVIEIVVEATTNLTMDSMGKENRGYTPFVGTMLIFIALLNISGLFGFKPPTSDVNTTVGFGVLTFLTIQLSSIRKNGVLGHIKGYFEPMPLLFPVNVIGDLASPISLGFRLFGNVLAGVIVGSLLYGALAALSSSIGLSIPIFQAIIPVALHAYFDIFSGFLQSFIFTMLTMIFIYNAL